MISQRICPPWVVISLLFLIQQTAYCQTQYGEERDILYRDNAAADAYIDQRCRLDIYYPKSTSGYATVVWFHGGGLEQGNKEIPAALKEKDIAVVAVNYRFSPVVKAPAYIDDAAAAVAWVFTNIGRYGGAKDRIFVSGHSAGGYLTSMIGLDKSWLQKYQIDANNIAGLIPYSGHTVTHFTIRKERGIADTQVVVDNLAPLFHVRQDAPPLLLITGDREKELLGRYEENAYLWRMMKVAGHKKTDILELDGYDHGGMAAPAHPLLLDFIRKQP
jgi:acetyl esterase/lipase